MANNKPIPASESEDDYLKAILELGGAEAVKVTTKDLAQKLGLRPPSVTGMLQKLAAQTPPLVSYEKYQGVSLTRDGARRAWELVRHHRLLELFLHNVLKYSWDEVHEEADRLEHFISERFEDRMAAVLGDPTLDPHGHPIPQQSGFGTFRQETALTGWPLGIPATISSVSDDSPQALRELERLGLMPGVRLTVLHSSAAKSLTVGIVGRQENTRLSESLAVRIHVVA